VSTFQRGDRVYNRLHNKHGRITTRSCMMHQRPHFLADGSDEQDCIDESWLILIKEETMVKDDDVVTATAGRIRSAAGKCPQANQVLREVYPEVFKEKIESEWMLGDIVRCLVKIDGYLDTINKTGIVVKVNADRRRIHVQFVWDVAGTSDQNGVWGTHDDFTLIRRPNLNCTPKS
jgi:hypothetical protein